MAALEFRQLGKSYGRTTVLDGVDLAIGAGEFVVFVGPSGCGKSTLLRMIAGLEHITRGELRIDDRRVNELPPSQRGIAMVFQSYALYPHMTVFDNMAFGLKIAKLPAAEIRRRVTEAASMLGLDPYLDRLPKALSGGQRQRVAIGRAIVRRPRVFLFDEPLSNLDAALRVATRIEIARLKESLPDTTMIYVTHDQVEAMTLADRIVVLSGGRIEQVGTPVELYRRPANLFVARFIGTPAMNVLDACVSDAGDRVEVALGETALQLPIAAGAALRGRPVKLGMRPEDLVPADGDDAILSGPVSLVESLGEVTNVYVDVAGAAEPVVAKLAGTRQFRRGETIRLAADPGSMHLFDADGRAILHGTPADD
ncbi:MAG: sn-glycerol-3-phosphate ABC transporter ATP-binding protein UgpC [Rhodocyclaceae bacterium]|nr:sn-glycerol-3-phosphate ABC transporter ATP-binding protein UgpC [Rhodocyclaceae bacterium]